LDLVQGIGLCDDADVMMNAYYLEVSFGQVSVSGKVYGWYTLPQPWSYYVNSEYPLGNRRVIQKLR